MDRFHPYLFPSCLWRFQHRQRLEYIRQKMLEMPGANQVALDAGAGKGPFTYIMSGHFDVVHSFEYSETELDALKKNLEAEAADKFSNVNIKQVDLQSIPLETQSVDFAVCSEVLEHIPDYEKAVAELFRVVKPGGKVIFSMPNRYSFFWMYNKFIYHLEAFVKRRLGRPVLSADGYDYWELSRHWAFSPRQIRNIVTSSGFEIMDKQGVSVLLHNERLTSFLYKFGLLGKTNVVETFLGRIFPSLGACYFLVLRRSYVDD